MTHVRWGGAAAGGWMDEAGSGPARPDGWCKTTSRLRMSCAGGGPPPGGPPQAPPGAAAAHCKGRVCAFSGRAGTGGRRARNAPGSRHGAARDGGVAGVGGRGGGCTAVRKAPRSPRSRPRPVGAGPPRWGHAPAPPRDAPARDARADGPWPAPPWASRPVTAAGCGWGRRGAGRAALPATHSPPPMAVERTPLPGHGEERAVLSPALPPPPHPSARGGLPTPRILAGRGVFGTLSLPAPPPLMRTASAPPT